MTSKAEVNAAIEVLADGHVTTPRGFIAGAVCAGLYSGGPKAGELDLALLFSEHECNAAAVFTQNLVKGWPVIVSQHHLDGGQLRAIAANSGCSNSLNGPQGHADALEMAGVAAAYLGLAPEQVSVASTGVTGVLMPMPKIREGVLRVDLSSEGGHDFARAIMTTDTRPKEIAVRVQAGAGSYAIGGCAKGSGMIHPNMATMLAYITTDAAVEAEFLRDVHREVADLTLNMIDVDGDTSCSDMFLVLANGASGLPPIHAGTVEAEAFREGLLTVATHLARELARDGEGARHLIEVEVKGAVSLEDARLMARTVTNSPLVKTAAAGQDPNWGRILVAAGRSGAYMEESHTSLTLQGFKLFDHGLGVPFDEKAVSDRLGEPEIRIEIDLGLGEHSATAWGCDLTTGYVHINADYRT